MAKHSELAKALEPRLERACRDLAVAHDLPWRRRTKLVAGNFTQCPKSRSDMWGKTGTRNTSHGPQCIYVNVRTIQEHIPHRIVGGLKRAAFIDDPEVQVKELKRLAKNLDDWVDYWLHNMLAPRVVDFAAQLDAYDGQAVAEGRNLFDSISSRKINRIWQKMRERGYERTV